MKKIILIVALASVLTSCGNSSGSAADSDTNVNSITPPPTADTNNAVAPMMGDTSKIDVDSLKK